MINLDRVAIEQARVSRYDVAKPQSDHISRHQLTCLGILPLAVPLDLGQDRQARFQSCDCVTGLVLFPESDHGVRTKQKKDDEKIKPMLNQRRQDHGAFDHPRNGTPEIREKLQKLIGLLLINLVGAVLGQALLSLGLAKSIRGRAQLLLQLRHRQGLEIVLGH